MFKTHKGIPAVLLIAVMLLVAACGSTSSGPATAPPETSTATPAPSPVAEEFPSKAITIYVPYAPGGGADLSARAVATILPQYLPNNVAVIVENKPGGNGAIAHSFFKGVEPDGYTLCISGQSPVTLTPLIADVDYSIDDFEFVSRFVGLADMIAVRSDSPFQSINDMIEYSKSHPGAVTCANAGATGVCYYMVEAINNATGSKLVSVSTDGASAALASTLGGEAMVYFGSLSTAASAVANEDMRILAFLCMSDPSYPDVPLLTEMNVGIDYAPGNFIGLIAPKGTPADRIEILDNAIAQVVQDEGFIALCKKLSLPIMHLNTEDFKEATYKEIEVCTELVEMTGL